MPDLESHVDKSAPKIAAMFAAIARRYDLLNHLLSCNLDRSWRKAAVASLQPPDQARVLDICAGTGDLSLAYLRRHRADLVYLADFAMPMLEIARRKVRPGAGTRVSYCGADALRLPFADASFDVILCAFGVRNFEDTEAGLRELCRVLTPGGQMVIVEFCHSTGDRLPLPLRLFIRQALPLVGRLVSGHGFAYSYLPRSITGFLERDDLAAMLRRLGLCHVAAQDRTFGVVSVLVGSKPEEG